MKAWTPEHQTLLNALQANRNVPELYRRLSLERLSPTDADIRRLRGWSSSLQQDAGWTVMAPLIRQPSAWPKVWEDAFEAGFSPTTNHHHALLFADFCDSLLRQEDYQSAEWVWQQALRSWAEVFSSDYPAALYDDLAPKLSEDGPQKDALLETMLDRLIEARGKDLRSASGLETPEVGGVDRRRLRFAWRNLAFVDELASDMMDDPYGTFARLARLSSETRGAVNGEVLSRFEKAVEGIDFADAKGDDLLAPFRWVGEYFGIVGYSEQASTQVVSVLVESCWTLRRVGRDEIKEFNELIAIGTPFNDDLFERLKSMKSAFGHNSKCADFLVFVGEQADRDAKKEIFSRGLEICPGHRNSAMLLSYQYLHDASGVLTKITLGIPGTAGRNSRLVREAHELVKKAEELYPYNESLPEWRDRIEQEAARFDVNLDS